LPGVFNLDAPARLYLPEADFEGYDVTTRQLLSHTSGLWEALNGSLAPAQSPVVRL
jgi:CubicO group peptidase (beta-lactamase class C family)